MSVNFAFSILAAGTRLFQAGTQSGKGQPFVYITAKSVLTENPEGATPHRFYPWG
ncbi:hypothetical protein [Moorena sp. SIO3H5]|uniref:hypothetical protein n=1 Tax=Moorena sp. SIO3H5 TaxID=2607834 RepID=UPI0025E7F9AD|nr:hypothetical protein [Moorena sp. SIO3H5]